MGLAQLVDSLAHEREWSRELSGGEQQRIGLARALLCAPQTLYLDEATNQLDEPSACQLLETVRQALPNTLIIGISHQPAVARLFSRTLTLEVQERALALSDNR